LSINKNIRDLSNRGATLHIAAKGNGKGVGFHNITYIRV